MKLLRLLSAAVLLGLAGCGASFDVTIANSTSGPVRVALEDQGPTGDQTPFFEADIAAGTTLSYSMRDGPRGEQKSLRVTNRSGIESRMSISDSGTTATEVTTVGERLHVTKHP